MTVAASNATCTCHDFPIYHSVQTPLTNYKKALILGHRICITINEAFPSTQTMCTCLAKNVGMSVS